MFVLVELETAVTVGLVGRSIDIDGAPGGRGLLLLGAGSGEVVGEYGSLTTVTVEDMVFRVVDIVVVVNSLDVFDGLDVRTSESTVHLLVIVDR